MKVNPEDAMRELANKFDDKYLFITDAALEGKNYVKTKTTGESIAGFLTTFVIGTLTQGMVIVGDWSYDFSYAVVTVGEDRLTIYEMHKENNYTVENLKSICSIPCENISKLKLGWCLGHIVKIWFSSEHDEVKVKLSFVKRLDSKKIVSYLKKLKEQIKLRDG